MNTCEHGYFDDRCPECNQDILTEQAEQYWLNEMASLACALIESEWDLES